MRVLAPLLFLAISSCLQASLFNDVHLQRKPASDFTRIGEYFGKPENTGARFIIRSEPQQRSGLYWILELDRSLDALPDGSSVRLRWYPGGESQYQTRNFPLEGVDSRSVLYIGLTGDEKLGPDGKPIAWLIEVVGPDGKPIDTAKSFLWEHPGG